MTNLGNSNYLHSWSMECLSSHWQKLCRIRADLSIPTASAWLSSWTTSKTPHHHTSLTGRNLLSPTIVQTTSELAQSLDIGPSNIWSPSSIVARSSLPTYRLTLWAQLSVGRWSLLAISPGLPGAPVHLKVAHIIMPTKHLNFKKRLPCSAGLGFSSSLP